MKPVAMITGAGRGIGRATAVLLAERGYAVALISRTEPDLRETAELIERQSPSPGTPGEGGGEGEFVAGTSFDVRNHPHPNPLPGYRERGPDAPLILSLDVTQPDAVSIAVAKVLEHFGRIDVIVNSAGVAPLLPIEQTTPAIWRNVIETNLSAVHSICHAAWPIFKQQHRGVIINISSEAARDPFDGFSAYGAAKAGLNLLGKALAREGAAIGVRVHTIAPAAVETGMFRKLLTPEQFPPEHTLAAADVARIVMQCIDGDLIHSSGEVIYAHRQIG